jgi:fructokinase
MAVARQAVLLFGEVLVDRFPEGEVLGGAPFNVAHHLAAFGCKPVLITRIGQDNAGSRVLQALESAGLPSHGVQLDSTHPTGAVEVKFGSQGHRFDILPDQAYDHIHPRLSRIASLAANPELLYFGTLAQRAHSHRALRHLLRAVHGCRFFDVNLRDPWVYSNRLQWLLQHADIVKANDTELEAMNELLGLQSASAHARAEALLNRYGLQGILTTSGAKGASWLNNSGQFVEIESDPIPNILDTVGAGDAFSAVFIVGLLHEWEMPITLRRANRFAAAICQIRGAVPEDTGFYKPFLDEWLTADE